MTPENLSSSEMSAHSASSGEMRRLLQAIYGQPGSYQLRGWVSTDKRASSER